MFNFHKIISLFIFSGIIFPHGISEPDKEAIVQGAWLDYLYLGVNEMTIIPESICAIASNLTTLNISQNNVCPPYPICLEGFVGEQNTSECP